MASPPTDTGARNTLWGVLLMEELVRLGLRQVIMAPGSRSTPLALAAARHPRLRTLVHFDERGAGFLALGLARATGQPVALICTSGSALANLMPAVVEAHLDAVPLVLLTADRPPELRGVGANQTMDQVGFFGRQVRYAVDLPCPGADLPCATLLGAVDQAWQAATANPPGPVHLNVMLREPLLPAADSPLAGWRDPATVLAHWAAELPTGWIEQGGPFWQTHAPPASGPDAASVSELAATLAGQQGLMVVGKLTTEAERQAVRELAAHLQWPVYPDLLSGLRLGPDFPQRLAHADLLLLPGAPGHAWQPDGVLYIGGRAISKRLQSYLDSLPTPPWRLQAEPRRYDPGLRGGRTWHGDLPTLMAALRAALPPATGPSAALARLRAAEARGVAALDAALSVVTAPLSEAAVARELPRCLPAGQHLLLAASLPVREMDSYGASDGPALRPWSNRGASGIDGTLATAAGLAQAGTGGVTVLIGDLACLHDLNSLALLRGLPVLVIVLNNDGGGIFEFLPVAGESDAFERCFAASHGLHFSGAAVMFGLRYATPRTLAELRLEIQAALTSGQPALLEIRTERRATHLGQRELQRQFLAATRA